MENWRFQTIVKMDERGRVVIPKPVRAMMGVRKALWLLTAISGEVVLRLYRGES